MSISLGGLGLMSLHNPFAELVGMVLGKTDLRSMFCLVVFLIIVFVLGQYSPTLRTPPIVFFPYYATIFVELTYLTFSLSHKPIRELFSCLSY
jgi:hypothetical protein